MENVRTASSVPIKVIPDFISNLVSIFVPLIIMISFNLELTIIILTPTILFILSAFIFGKKVEETQLAIFEKNASIFSYLKESLSMIPLIKVFGLEKRFQKKLNTNMNDFYGKYMKYNKFFSLNMAFDSLIFGIPIVILILVGGPMVINEKISVGTFTAFITYIFTFFSPVSQLGGLWIAYKSSLSAVKRVKEIISLEKQEYGNENYKFKNGFIKFINVSFSYDNNKIVLENFNGEFKKGLNYLVGDNGAGKSTILKIICNLYSIQEGKVEIDGQDISKIAKNDITSNISMIFSEPYLFDGSIYENIHIGNINSSKKDVIKAAKLSQIHEFINTLPKKYDTYIGEEGFSLSSGEKQKIALARTIIKDTPIILLDEATRSVDYESRKLINNVIESFRNEKTIIIVTHNAKDIKENSNIINLGDIK